MTQLTGPMINLLRKYFVFQATGFKYVFVRFKFIVQQAAKVNEMRNKQFQLNQPYSDLHNSVFGSFSIQCPRLVNVQPNIKDNYIFPGYFVNIYSSQWTAQDIYEE